MIRSKLLNKHAVTHISFFCSMKQLHVGYWYSAPPSPRWDATCSPSQFGIFLHFGMLFKPSTWLYTDMHVLFTCCSSLFALRSSLFTRRSSLVTLRSLLFALVSSLFSPLSTLHAIIIIQSDLNEIYLK